MNKRKKVLMYHSIGKCRISEIGAELYCVPVDKFREQMKLIKTWGQSPKDGDSPQVTFDDGLDDNFTNAYPILKELGLIAYFFVMPEKVETKGYLSWEQVREMSASGMIIGSHGMTHRILTELNDTELDYELRESKRLLEEKLGATIDYFSVPRGFYNKKVITKAKEIGYKAVFTSDYNDNDGYCIGRIAVKNTWDIKHFSKIIASGLTLSDRIESAVKNTAKSLLGAKTYDKLRTKLLGRRVTAPRNETVS